MVELQCHFCRGIYSELLKHTEVVHAHGLIADIIPQRNRTRVSALYRNFGEVTVGALTGADSQPRQRLLGDHFHRNGNRLRQILVVSCKGDGDFRFTHRIGVDVSVVVGPRHLRIAAHILDWFNLVGIVNHNQVFLKQLDGELRLSVKRNSRCGTHNILTFGHGTEFIADLGNSLQYGCLGNRHGGTVVNLHGGVPFGTRIRPVGGVKDFSTILAGDGNRNRLIKCSCLRREHRRTDTGYHLLILHNHLLHKSVIGGTGDCEIHQYLPFLLTASTGSECIFHRCGGRHGIAHLIGTPAFIGLAIDTNREHRIDHLGAGSHSHLLYLAAESRRRQRKIARKATG